MLSLVFYLQRRKYLKYKTQNPYICYLFWYLIYISYIYQNSRSLFLFRPFSLYSLRDNTNLVSTKEYYNKNLINKEYLEKLPSKL